VCEGRISRRDLDVLSDMPLDNRGVMYHHRGGRARTGLAARLEEGRRRTGRDASDLMMSARY